MPASGRGASRGRWATSAVASLIALATAAPAVAQQATAADAAAGAFADGDIVVTARKREERLQDVPISISVQSGETLENQSISSFMGLQARVPALSVTDTPANASLFIRGIGTSGNTLSFEQSVSLFLDQVYGGRNRQFMQPFFDVERIEVLRGPQGALFGRNTSAGAISVTTRRPTRDFEGSVFGEVEMVRGSHVVEMTASGPVSDTLALRVATRYGKGIGWLDNVVLDRREPVREDITARVSALWEPAADITVFGRLDYGYADIVGTPFEFVPGGGRPVYRNAHNNGLRPLGDRSDALNGVLQVDIGLGDHVLTAVTGYSGFDYTNSFNIQVRTPARLVTENSERFWQWSQEVRLASPGDRPFSYIVGGYAETSKSDIFRLSIINLPPPPVPNNETHRFFDQRTDVVAGFGQLDWQPVEQLSVSGGLRWTRIIKRGNLSGFTRIFQPGGVVINQPRAPLSDRFTETDWSPTASISWRPTRDVTLYGRYAQGQKGGAFSEFQAVTPETFLLLPEQSETFEAGVRLAVPRLGGFFSLSAFTTDYSDLQKSSLDINTASFITSNAAGARTRGFELDGSLRLAEGITLSGALAYLDARFTFYPEGPCAFPRNLEPACIEDRTGDRLQNSPEWTGNIALDVDRAVGDVRLLASWFTRFQDAINYQDFLDPLHEQKAFSKTDVRLGLAALDRRWEVALLVRNLFDARTSGLIFSVFPVDTNPALDRAHMPDPRRSFTLQGRIRF